MISPRSQPKNKKYSSDLDVINLLIGFVLGVLVTVLFYMAFEFRNTIAQLM